MVPTGYGDIETRHVLYNFSWNPVNPWLSSINLKSFASPRNIAGTCRDYGLNSLKGVVSGGHMRSLDYSSFNLKIPQDTIVVSVVLFGSPVYSPQRTPYHMSYVGTLEGCCGCLSIPIGVSQV